MVRNCPQREVICFRCQQPGHIATYCPQSQSASSSSSASRLVQSVRGGFQDGCGGRFGGRGNHGRGARSSQGNVGAGRGRIFTITQDEAQNSQVPYFYLGKKLKFYVILEQRIPLSPQVFHIIFLCLEKFFPFPLCLILL
ncbi:hypothetical protein LIER_34885 [Lithospermum erythrorhizon]|uniref:CCHC-type domain-containing protein n=1 Tax=Lithospermum erythrorhizon TaxID=34254 RepID=A0AAV3S230_LITER